MAKATALSILKKQARDSRSKRTFRAVMYYRTYCDGFMLVNAPDDESLYDLDALKQFNNKSQQLITEDLVVRTLERYRTQTYDTTIDVTVESFATSVSKVKTELGVITNDGDKVFAEPNSRNQFGYRTTYLTNIAKLLTYYCDANDTVTIKYYDESYHTDYVSVPYMTVECGELFIGLAPTQRFENDLKRKGN